MSRLIIWHPFRPIFFKIFSIGDGWQTFGGEGGRDMPRLWIILEKGSRTWKTDFSGSIFSIVPMAS